jgi:thiamine biosynthesis lipoprotein
VLKKLVFPYILLFIVLSACRTPPPESRFALGTVCTVNLYEEGKPALYREIFARLDELEDILSANREGSDLDRVNRNAGEAPVKVRPELIEVLDKALFYAEVSGGAFDPAVGPLVKLWGIGGDSPRIPLDGEIAEALTLIKRRDIEIDRDGGTVFLKTAGMALDLGAIAKGYAADEAAKILERRKVKRAVIDLGGNVLTLGEKKGGDPWRIGLQDPQDSRGSYLGILEVKNKSIVTSGVYERFFEEGGRRYHHILSADTGFPAETGLLSVTIVADHSVDADALSTAVFVLGIEEGERLIASIPHIEGIIVQKEGIIRVTEGLKGIFTITNEHYTEQGAGSPE